MVYRCGEDTQEQEIKENKCVFLENSGSEEHVLQILQYMATILGNCVCVYVYGGGGYCVLCMLILMGQRFTADLFHTFFYTIPSIRNVHCGL